MEFDKEIIDAFLQRATRVLRAWKRDELEENPTDPELLAKIFRTVHNKSRARELPRIHPTREPAHDGESPFCVTDRRVSLNPDVVDAPLALVDAVRRDASRTLRRTEQTALPQPRVDRLRRWRKPVTTVWRAGDPATVPTGITPQTTTCHRDRVRCRRRCELTSTTLDSPDGPECRAPSASAAHSATYPRREDTPLADAQSTDTSDVRAQSDVERSTVAADRQHHR